MAQHYQLGEFKFVDATWNTSAKKVNQFCELYKKTKNRIPWEANIHAAFTTEEMFFKMKEAGCRQINVGCESGSQKFWIKWEKGFALKG